MQKPVKAALESHLSHTLKGLNQDEQIALAEAHLERLGPKASPDAVETLRSALNRASSPPERERLEAWLGRIPKTGNAGRLGALLSADLNLPAAAEAWKEYLAAEPLADPTDRLAYARVLADAGDFNDAALQLRRVLSEPLPYPLLARSEKLIARVAERDTNHLRTVRIAILGNSTTAFLTPVLKALCFGDRIRAEIYEGMYGAQQQELLDERNALAEFRAEIVVLPLSWRDLQLPPVADDAAELIDRLVGERQQLWKCAADRFGCHVIQFSSDYPANESFGLLAARLPGGRTSVIDSFNRALIERAPPFVSILDAAESQRRAAAGWEDPLQWASYRQHPAPAALPELAASLVAQIRAVLGLTRKIVVTDLDNTLWKGVIGEDGLDGIEAGPGSPAGEAHQGLQRYLKELRQRGILLAVSSKNNPEDARLPFEQHAGMALKLEDFAAFKANWDDKAQNIRRIAEELSLGLESFVFLDDNPLEREWVRSQIPALTVVELGSSVFQWVREIDRGRYFQALQLSAEDLSRAEQYQQQASRETIRSAYGSMDEFLAQLHLEAAVEPVSAANLPRVTQLINKTNQFNLTTRRYTELQVSELAATPLGWAGAFQMADRFGSYGLIGVILCRAAGAGAWEIDTWLMSCRTLGRQMEKFMFDRLIEAAIERDIRTLIGVYRPSAKNKMVAAHYTQMGFRTISETAEEFRYELAVHASPAPAATHVRDISRVRMGQPAMQA